MSWEKEEHRSRHVDFANVSTFHLVQVVLSFSLHVYPSVTLSLSLTLSFKDFIQHFQCEAPTDPVEAVPLPINLNAVDEIEQIQQQSQ